MMKTKTMSFVMLFFSILGWSAFAMATISAVDATPDSKDHSVAVIIAVGLFLNSVGNIGSIVFFVKRYISRIDRAGETLPALIATLESTRNAMDQHAKSIEELYDTRSSHAIKLAKIETIYKMHGCDQGVSQQSERR